MNTDKLFYVTLEWVCDYNAEYNHNHDIKVGFNKFDTAVEFAETVMDNTKNYLTKCVNFTVTWR